jgi:hypothetical protein
VFGWFRKKEEETSQKPKRRSANVKVQQSNKWQKKKIKNLKASSRFADKGKD